MIRSPLAIALLALGLTACGSQDPQQQASAALGLHEKSLAVRLTLARSDATLTDEQIEAAVRAVVERVCAQLGGRLRG